MNNYIIYLGIITSILSLASAGLGGDGAHCHYMLVYLPTQDIPVPGEVQPRQVCLISTTISGIGKIKEISGQDRLIIHNKDHADLLAGFINKTNADPSKTSTGKPRNENFDLFVIKSEANAPIPTFPSIPMDAKDNKGSCRPKAAPSVWQRATEVKTKDQDEQKFNLQLENAPDSLIIYTFITGAAAVQTERAQGYDSEAVRATSSATDNVEAGRSGATDVVTGRIGGIHIVPLDTGVGELVYTGPNNYSLRAMAVGLSLGDKLVLKLKSGNVKLVTLKMAHFNPKDGLNFFAWPNAQEMEGVAANLNLNGEQSVMQDIIVKSWVKGTRSVDFEVKPEA